MHRVENLLRLSRREGLVALAAEAAGRGPVWWVIAGFSRFSHVFGTPNLIA